MIVEKTTLSYINFLNNFVVMGLYALKSANRISLLDMVGTFFVFKKIFYRSRGPPNINLNFKNLNWLEEIKLDKHSKRNKSKDNPYTLSYNETTNSYVVEFKDNKNNTHKVEISEEVYKAFDKFELEDISQIHKYRKHIEHSEVFEETLMHRAINKPISIEEEVEGKLLFEDLRNAINQLSEVQKRRIKMYYFENMNVKEIALIENTTHQAVSKSIRKGIEEIKKNIKN